ncbi:hypothetical protein DRW41_05005 [Neobacillus piezotolerans]|uniref:Uncharacterized protein n=1 Tax=Neobacillus piezotolerans TaxID=2259171 RepID=A0A3D8GXY3_9BACI|nr:hypothetical protein DRW41_05005 [Neobacillus piezotolerans]
MESHPLDYDTLRHYLLEKWEIAREEGKLLYSEQELQRVLKLLVFNLGIEKALNTIPREQIKISKK